MEDVLVQRSVKTTIQKLYDKSLFNNFDTGDEILNNFLLTRRRPALEESK